MNVDEHRRVPASCTRLNRKVALVLMAVFGAAVVVHPTAAQTVEQAAPVSERSASDYVIGVEDNLEISIWREPDLTRTVVVRPDGKITLPLIGDVVAAGRSPSELDDEITRGLQVFIKEPVVTVIVTGIESFKVFVIGEIASQGVLSLKRRTRLLEAIAMSGGLNEFADKSNLVVVRDDGGKETRIRVDYKKLVSGDRPELNIYLKPGDTIIAN